MKVKMGKPKAVFLYAILRQAERSLDNSFFATWEGLRAYYDSDRLKMIQSSIDFIEGLLSKNEFIERSKLREYIESDFNHPLRNIFDKIFYEISDPKFSQYELIFIKIILEDFYSLLLNKECPDRVYLVRLRMDLNLCELVIQNKFFKNKIIEMSAYVEHFNQSDHLKTFSLKCIVEVLRKKYSEKLIPT